MKWKILYIFGIIFLDLFIILCKAQYFKTELQVRLFHAVPIFRGVPKKDLTHAVL